MKNLNYLFLTIISICLLFSCNKPEEDFGPNNTDENGNVFTDITILSSFNSAVISETMYTYFHVGEITEHQDFSLVTAEITDANPGLESVYIQYGPTCYQCKSYSDDIYINRGGTTIAGNVTVSYTIKDTLGVEQIGRILFIFQEKK